MRNNKKLLRGVQGSGFLEKSPPGRRQKIGIYIHIPFCKRGCFYCHFFKRGYDPDLVDKYTRAVAAEIRLRTNPGYVVDSIYIGGGSPSLLQERLVAVVMGAVNDHFKMAPSVECSLEANPEDVSENKLRCWKELGINRLSIGTQSFIQEDLNYLKRTHDVSQSLKAIENALKMGFSNINTDFIISLPTQTRETLKDTFSVLKNYHIPHVSAYLLEEVEESEEKSTRDNDLYFFTRDFLGQLGYIHYEVSNFSRTGFQSRHNLKYWKNESYIGIGLSAAGYENGSDYKNTIDFDEYFEKINQGKLPQVEIDASDDNVRAIVMGLRLLEGISIDYFNDCPEELEFLLSNGFLVRRDGRIAVNPGKLLLLNEILIYFLPTIKIATKTPRHQGKKK
jgi:oxygen-independent coproporphyrinogen-3 oxidase